MCVLTSHHTAEEVLMADMLWMGPISCFRVTRFDLGCVRFCGFVLWYKYAEVDVPDHTTEKVQEQGRRRGPLC